jgi:hypothetical protein
MSPVRVIRWLIKLGLTCPLDEMKNDVRLDLACELHPNKYYYII